MLCLAWQICALGYGAKSSSRVVHSCSGNVALLSYLRTNAGCYMKQLLHDCGVQCHEAPIQAYDHASCLVYVPDCVPFTSLVCQPAGKQFTQIDTLQDVVTQDHV